MFSKTCKYALNVMIFVASLPEGKNRAGLREISKAINSPEAFTAKILQQLVRGSLLNSAKGPHGGFAVKGDSHTITIAQIVAAIDGDMVFTGCALGLEKCMLTSIRKFQKPVLTAVANFFPHCCKRVVFIIRSYI